MASEPASCAPRDSDATNPAGCTVRFMTDRVVLQGGHGDGQVAELEDASTGATTLWFEDGDERWGERYLVRGGVTARDPQTGDQVPVFTFMERVEAR